MNHMLSILCPSLSIEPTFVELMCAWLPTPFLSFSFSPIIYQDVIGSSIVIGSYQGSHHAIQSLITHRVWLSMQVWTFAICSYKHLTSNDLCTPYTTGLIYGSTNIGKYGACGPSHSHISSAPNLSTSDQGNILQYPPFSQQVRIFGIWLDCT